MICSLCLNACPRYQTIPCGHHVCLSCVQAHVDQDNMWRCQTCLQTFFLEMKGNDQSQRSQQGHTLRLFCLECQQCFAFSHLRTGIHNNHTFDRLEKCLPFLKQKCLEKLNKGLVIESMLLLNTQEQVDQPYYHQIHQLTAQIRSYFEEERQMIAQKQRKIMDEVMHLQQKIANILQARKSQFLELYEKLHEINEALQGFITDEVTFEVIDVMSLLRMPKQEQFMAKIRAIQKEAIDIPKFVSIRPSTHNISAYSYLKYPQSINLQTHEQEEQRSSSKRVHLKSKITRKLNWI